MGLSRMAAILVALSVSCCQWYWVFWMSSSLLLECTLYAFIKVRGGIKGDAVIFFCYSDGVSGVHYQSHVTCR